MRVLMLQRFDIANVGCAERIWRQAQVLSNRGHQVTLVNMPHPQRRACLPRLREDAPKGVRLVELDRSSSGLRSNMARLRTLLPQHDLIHLWKCYPDTAVPLLWALRSQNLPVHYDWDDLEGGEGGIAERLTGCRLVGKLMAFWEREILNWSDTVSVASSQIAALCEQYGFPVERTFRVPVGAVAQPVSQPAPLPECLPLLANRLVMVFLGQLEADDFPVDLLTGLKPLFEQHPAALLLMIGDGSARRQLEKVAGEHGLMSHVVFTGYLAHQQAQTVLAHSDIFFFPLRDDLMSRCKSPLVVLEALSHGLVVIGSQVGEVPAMVGSQGVLMNSLDPADWCSALVDLLREKDHLSQRKDQIRQWFLDNWTWEHSVNSLEQAYQSALSDNKRLL